MKYRYQVNVLRDGSNKHNLWIVHASTINDAIQLAFALDGGWAPTEQDATGMLELAKMYCHIKSFELLPKTT